MSPVNANLFMEWLEQQACLSAPITCKPKLWKRYVDDVMEIVRKGCEQELTEHLNSIDTTGIKFTYEEESGNCLPFLDTLVIRKEDGTVKLLVYRTLHAFRPISELHIPPSVTTETRGHQNATGVHHQSTKNMWVPKLDHKEGERTAISEEEKNKEKNTEKSKGMVTLPYVKGET